MSSPNDPPGGPSAREARAAARDARNVDVADTANAAGTAGDPPQATSDESFFSGTKLPKNLEKYGDFVPIGMDHAFDSTNATTKFIAEICASNVEDTPATMPKLRLFNEILNKKMKSKPKNWKSLSKQLRSAIEDIGGLEIFLSLDFAPEGRLEFFDAIWRIICAPFEKDSNGVNGYEPEDVPSFLAIVFSLYYTSNNQIDNEILKLVSMMEDRIRIERIRMRRMFMTGDVGSPEQDMAAKTNPGLSGIPTPVDKESSSLPRDDIGPPPDHLRSQRLEDKYGPGPRRPGLVQADDVPQTLSTNRGPSPTTPPALVPNTNFGITNPSPTTSGISWDSVVTSARDLKLQDHMSDQDRRDACKQVQTFFTSQRQFDGGAHTKSDIVKTHLDYARILRATNATEDVALQHMHMCYKDTAQTRFNQYMTRARANGSPISFVVVVAHMEEMFDNYASQMLAETNMQQLRLDESLSTSHQKMQSYLDEMERLRRRCGKDMQSDARMIQCITSAVSGVDWAHLTMRSYLMKHVRERNFEDLRGFLLHAAMDDDRTNERTTESPSSGTYFYDGSRDRGFENRRTAFPPRNASAPRQQNSRQPNFKRFVSSSNIQSNWKQNPIDRATGKPMVCRSKGCGSTSHFQFSGRCPIQQSRVRSGTQAAYLADCLDEDPEQCCKEILYSAMQDAEEQSGTPPRAGSALEDNADLDRPLADNIFDTSDGYDENGNWVMSSDATLEPFPTGWCDLSQDEAVNFSATMQEDEKRQETTSVEVEESSEDLDARKDSRFEKPRVTGSSFWNTLKDFVFGL